MLSTAGKSCVALLAAAKNVIRRHSSHMYAPPTSARCFHAYFKTLYVPGGIGYPGLFSSDRTVFLVPRE